MNSQLLQQIAQQHETEIRRGLAKHFSKEVSEVFLIANETFALQELKDGIGFMLHDQTGQLYGVSAKLDQNSATLTNLTYALLD